MKVVFSSEKENCAAIYVGILKKYIGEWDSLDGVKAKLPNWEKYRKWCWHPLSKNHENWSNKFLESCKRDKSILDALLDEVSELIEEAYAAMKQVLGGAS